MSATLITYSGVPISNVLTRSYSASPVYDESGTVVRSIRHRIAFEGTATSATHDGFGTSLAALTDRLNRPRQALRIDVGSRLLWDVRSATDPQPASPATRDIDSGPLPIGIEATRIIGGRGAQVSGAFEWTTQVHPTAAIEELPVIVSNTWSQEFRVDVTNLSTRTVRGSIRFSRRIITDSNTGLYVGGPAAGISPDAFRAHVRPVQTPGFRLIEAQFVVSSDGLGLSYVWVEQEGFRTYPNGILEVSSDYSVTVERLAVVYKDFAVSLRAAKGVPRTTVIQAAFNALQQRISPLSGDMILNLSMTEGDVFNQNAFSLSCRAQSSVSLTATSSVSVQGFRFFAPLTSGTSVSPYAASGNFLPITPYGSAMVQAVYEQIFEPSTDGGVDVVKPLDAGLLASTKKAQAVVMTTAPGAPSASSVAPIPNLAAFESADSYTDGVVGAEIGDAEIGDPAAPRLVSTEQASANPYTRVTVSRSLNVITNAVILPTASTDHADVIHQIRSPTVTVTQAGVLRRFNASPVVPMPPELTATPRCYVLKAYEAKAMTPEIGADGKTIEYGVAYAMTMERVYDPADAAWDDAQLLTVAGTEGAYVTYREDELPQPVTTQLTAEAYSPDLPTTLASTGYSTGESPTV